MTAVGLLGLVLLGFAGSTPAQADDRANRLELEISLTAEGQVAVSQTLDFGGAAPETVTVEIATEVNLGDAVRSEYTVSDIAAEAGGQTLAVASETKDGHLVLSLTTGRTTEPINLRYAVRGATSADADGSVRFSWNALQGLSVGVGEVSGRLVLPAVAVDYICDSGQPGAVTTCATYTGGTHGSSTMVFTDTEHQAGDILTVGAVFPAGAVQVTEQLSQGWSLSRALSWGWPQITAAVGIVVIGGLALFGVSRRRRAALAPATPRTVASFETDPNGHIAFVVSDQIRPGLVGTLADGSVDPADILASLLDLAMRGHLRITELPRESVYAVPDWLLTRHQGGDALADYESQLLDAVAPVDAATRVSDLVGVVAASIGQMQQSLYEQVIKDGWFSRLPGTRSKWSPLVWVGLGLSVLVTAGLMLWTSWGLIGLALVAVALLSLLLVQDQPVQTPAGAAVAAGLGALSAELHSAPTDRLRPGHELADASAVLPYAVVLGGWERWLSALVAVEPGADSDAALDWYQAPEDWHLSDLPYSLKSFITVVIGALSSRV
ncbi:MAG: DUF2207 domain-containing protein [Propionibacteriaceae bacterium]|jgi:hypothetical protein|nr:DUF2207 domain-containing protein [Propionibacteriaceae bacterium]